MKAIIILLILVSFNSYGQQTADQIYESARYEIVKKNKAAFVAKIIQEKKLTTDQMISIEDTYLQKEGVFKVLFSGDDKIIEVYYFAPVDFEIIEDLARMFFNNFTVKKPVKIDIIGGKFVYSDVAGE